MATPVMKSLHWLHVCFRMNFKIILVAVVWKVFFVMTPTYFSFPLSVLNCLEFLLLVLVTNHGRPDDIPVLFTIFINTSFHTYGCCSNTQLQLSRCQFNYQHTNNNNHGSQDQLFMQVRHDCRCHAGVSILPAAASQTTPRHSGPLCYFMFYVKWQVLKCFYFYALSWVSRYL